MKIIVFRDGSNKAVTGEKGKYWLCGEERFRKLSKTIAEVRDVAEPKVVNLSANIEYDGEIATASMGKPAPKKKTTKKKKEAETEDAKNGERGE